MMCMSALPLTSAQFMAKFMVKFMAKVVVEVHLYLSGGKAQFSNWR